MPKIKIGVQLRSLRQPLRQALHTAARLGAEAVEIDARSELNPRDLSETALRQFRKLLEDSRLRVSAVGFSTRRGYNVPDELDRRIAGTKEAMALARSLGTGVVINQVGRVPSEPAGPDWDLLVDVLGDLGRYGERIGAQLCAQTGSESGPDLARLLKALPEGAIGVNLSPGNLLVNGFSAVEAAELLGPDVRHVHAQDAVRDLARGRGTEVPLGRGSVDFPAILGILEEHNYRGYYTIERQNAADPMGEISQAIEYLKNL